MLIVNHLSHLDNTLQIDQQNVFDSLCVILVVFLINSNTFEDDLYALEFLALCQKYILLTSCRDFQFDIKWLLNI